MRQRGAKRRDTQTLHVHEERLNLLMSWTFKTTPDGFSIFLDMLVTLLSILAFLP